MLLSSFFFSICVSKRFCPATEKSEAMAPSKEMLVNPVKKVVDKKILMGKRGPRRKKGIWGR
jgi:hypothetical protein